MITSSKARQDVAWSLMYAPYPQPRPQYPGATRKPSNPL
ncbi:hypothetical protein UCMB321_0693 [Pseudomonas batumici]|uniref:Uncharacterized protein n=1 Tax=Pseudomonas batumici TaxID=226910 RepID=A0A0C2EHQ6_9PSED|nr:hypothetical protein UCMB321_0693 [Pseudomonas batumici]